MADILGFLKKAAPWITAAATCNVPALVGLAAQTVSGVTGGKVDASAESIAAAVAGASPEQLVALKQADNDFAVKMKSLDLQNVEDLEKLAADDRANARNREIQVKDWFPKALATVITICFIGVLGLIILHGLPESGHDAIMLLLGAVVTAWVGVVTYYFGSSAGSAAKTDIMAKAQSVAAAKE